ncbi:flagellar M-ring protein FliF [Novosphingobium sp. PC22D]|uniref:flagellar basal-body MS-ring/collar protein FliF n=1 Tax=Novosphingobium sp. PC22D TaxID=1962403 RepID=UPI000BEF4795|nr:flagellar basal-body MS-ring/collar protein FliF [Novosphingobium sp. PC22D]PEQ14304.1 flagellar M-ring protein FliF [Novosphingobium sp. PC22D]
MADLVPATGLATAADGGAGPASLLAPLTNPAGGSPLVRLGAFTAQPAVKRMAPWFIGVAALGGALLAWQTVSPSPQRVLYAQLADSERAGVAAALDQAAIDYTIDNTTGALTVAEGDYYRARMLVASDGALATPESGDAMLDSLPMGASRNLEGERLRSARERDLELTIREIDGVEAVRVHLAEAEKSVFVRENTPPTASVMVRLARGRQLSASQVAAVVNLVAASVPGLSPDAVRVADQHGRLLSDAASGVDTDRLDLQARMEEKLRRQVNTLLTPMLGEGNFTSEVQVELDMDEVTSARESYDKDGVVRTETEAQSQSTGPGPAVGVPGVLANTPPPQTQAQPAPPQGTQPPQGQQPPQNGESRSSRTYELGRQVSVSNQTPGGVRRLSVAVALSKDAMKGAKPQDLKELEALVGAAVGMDAQRGDQVKVMMRGFEPVSNEPIPFYETSWFAMLVRNGAAVLAVLLVLLLGVRPLVKALRGDKPAAKDKKDKKGRKAKGAENDDEDEVDVAQSESAGEDGGSRPAGDAEAPADAETEPQATRAQLLTHQVGRAQQLMTERPEASVHALRQMLNQQPDEAEKEKAA